MSTNITKTPRKYQSMNKFFVTILFLQILSFASFSQKIVAKANEAFDADEYFNAIPLYKNAYSKISEDEDLKAKIAFRIGYCYRRISKYEHADLWLGKATELRYSDPIVHLYYADALLANEKYDEAEKQYVKYKRLVPNDERIDAGLRSCRLAKQWTKHPTRYKLVNLAYVNSEFSDFCPVFGNEERTLLYFTSSRPGAQGDDIHGATGQSFADIFYSEIDEKGTWSTPIALERNINSKVEEGASCFNIDFSAFVFTRCDFSEKKESTCKIYVAENIGDGRFSDPWQFKTSTLKKDTFLVAHPALSADGLRLYFVSNMDGGEGGYDIWYISRPDKDSEWDYSPQNAGKEINTKGNEVFPAVRDDNTLFFSSDGHHGMGGLDIFRVNKDPKGNDQVVNLMYPMNSSADDFGITFYSNTEKGFLSSNRKGSVGYDDVYQFSLPPLKFSVKGTVFDEKTDKPLPGAKVKLIGNDGTSLEVAANSAGQYDFDLKPSTNYIIMASLKGYLNGKSKISTDGLEESKEFVADIYMTAVNIPVEIPNIMYDVGQWELRPESIVSLEKLVEILSDNPTITIELSSHTDYRTGAISNELLSQKRAEAVVDFLIVKGVSPKRLTAKGYGADSPKVIDKKYATIYTFFREGDVLTRSYIDALPAQYKEIAHQLNRRTEFRVLSTTFAE